MPKQSSTRSRFQITQNWRQYFSLTLAAIRESFIALVPYVIVSSLAILIGQFLETIKFESTIFDTNAIDNLINAPARYFPLALLVSLAFHTAKRFQSPPLISVLLSIVILFSLDSILIKDYDNVFFIYPDPSLLIVAIPITTTSLLKCFPLQIKYHLQDKTHHDIRDAHEIILPFVAVYIASIFLYSFIHFSISTIPINGINLKSLDHNLNYLLRVIIGQFLWFLGIHGTDSIGVIFGSDLYSEVIFDGLTYKQFHDLFVVCGGSGSGLSLLIAILLFSKNKQSFNIARVAIPFVIFNVNEILLFGFPVVLNRVLLTPFILVPILNILVARLCFPLLAVGIPIQQAPWTTPIFLNAYLTFTNGFRVIILQLFLLIVGIIIYRPYVTKISRLKNPDYHIQKMSNSLGLLKSFQAFEGVRFYEKQTSIIHESFKLNEVIELLQKNTLMIYYQPKVDIKKETCHQFEALLRLKKSNSRVVGPYFLESIENAGMSALIDLWVCRTVGQDLAIWRKQGIAPEISINLHPDTLGDHRTLQTIAAALMGQNIEFEIVERSLIEFSACKPGVLYLRDQGFNIALDDFGAGYSNLATLSELPIHTVKLDKSIVDDIEKPFGYKVIKHISALCIDLKFNCVAEGVETEQQLQLLKRIGVKYCQGYYFAKAMPLEDALHYRL
ncbi:MAG: EAL domain-containing protein [Cyanobacteria bacterium P01_G01_bin.54]